MLHRYLKPSLFVMLLSQALSVAAAPEPAPAYSEEQLARWQKLLVVAELKPGGYYEKKACPKDHVCISLSTPFWLNAKVSETLQGAEPPAQIRVSSASHWGMQRFATGEGPYLASLRSDGEKYVMPRYALAPLVRDKTGALYLYVLTKDPVPWLPCGIASLREEVLRGNFDNGEAIVTDQYKQVLANQAPDLYDVSGSQAWPRYAIAITRLREYLLKAGPDIEMSCKRASQVARPDVGVAMRPADMD